MTPTTLTFLIGLLCASGQVLKPVFKKPIPRSLKRLTKPPDTMPAGHSVSQVVSQDAVSVCWLLTSSLGSTSHPFGQPPALSCDQPGLFSNMTFSKVRRKKSPFAFVRVRRFLGPSEADRQSCTHSAHSQRACAACLLCQESTPAETALPEPAHFYRASWEAGNFYLLSAVHGSQYFTTCTSKKEGEEKHTNILKMFIFKECVFQRGRS